MALNLRRKRIDSYSREELTKALKTVAEIVGFRRFSRHEFDRLSTECKGTAVLSQFGTWDEALNSIGIKLEKRITKRKFISDDELLDELERIWKKNGQRPSKSEWEFSKPKYSYTTYKIRFKGWLNACNQLLLKRYSGLSPQEKLDVITDINNDTKIKSSSKIEILPEDTRNIPLKMKIKVLERDLFRCCFCGKSPSTDLGVKLHVDHIVPFSKGGKTVIDNLQILCSECNWGKGSSK